MRRFLASPAIFIFILAACGAPVPSPTSIPTVALTQAAAVATNTPVATLTLVPAPSPTISLGMLERPVFLAWPLPASIGLARISQYPNTAWTWNYLGLNPGYQCPPAFGYLLNLDSFPYWRDGSIPEEQDKAQADPHNFEMVECYSSGDNLGPNGHEGTDIKAPAGTPVYAAADGKILEWRLTGLNSMIVLKHCLGGIWDGNHQCTGGKLWYTTYMHIVTNKDLLQENKTVAQGTQVGTIYDQTINSHLHFEVGLEKRSYTNFRNPWGQDVSPWRDCMWLDQALCPHPDPEYNSTAFYTTDEKLLIQQGTNLVEMADAQAIKQVRLAGDRVALLDSDNRLLIPVWRYKNQFIADSLAEWATAGHDIVDFQMTNYRIAMLSRDRDLFVQADDINLAWVLQAKNVRAFSVSDHRVGYLTDNGDLLVKEGGLQNDWVAVAKNVSAFQLNDNRIAIVDEQGVLFVNEGEMLSEWKPMASHVKAFQVTNLRVGIIDADDNLLVKEGNLRAEWLTLAKSVRSFQLEDYRLLMLAEDGSFKLQTGNLYQLWSNPPYPGLKALWLNRETPVYIQQ